MQALGPDVVAAHRAVAAQADDAAERSADLDLAVVNAPVPAGISVAFEGEAPQPLGFTEIFDLLVGMADVPVGADKAQRIAAGATPNGMLRQNTASASSMLAQKALSISGNSTTIGKAPSAAYRPTRMLASLRPRLAIRSARRPPKTMPRQPQTATMLP